MFESLRTKLKSFVKKTEAVQTEVEKPKLTTATRVKSILAKSVKLSEKDIDSILRDLHVGLLQSDIAMETSEDIIRQLKANLTGKEIEKGKIHEFVQETLKGVLLKTLTPSEDISLIEQIKESEKPYLILFLGVNGTGKTTTIAKVADYLRRKGFSCVLAAGDTFRAGAIEQIDKHAKNLGIKVISHQKGADAAAVVYDGAAHAKARNIDVVLADSAGRMHTNVNLMDELTKIIRVNKPNLKIFVGDALTGNDALEQAREFNEKVGVDAVILTKMDADAKGGAAISIAHGIKKPILFVGLGQAYSDLKEFDSEWFVKSII